MNVGMHDSEISGSKNYDQYIKALCHCFKRIHGKCEICCKFCLLLCQCVFLCSLNGGNPVADQRGLLCSDSGQSYFRSLVCVCLQVYTCVTWERKHSVLLPVLQVLTVYMCVNILSPVHVRATVNKHKLVLLIKGFAVTAASFTLFLFAGALGRVTMLSVKRQRLSHRLPFFLIMLRTAS